MSKRASTRTDGLQETAEYLVTNKDVLYKDLKAGCINSLDRLNERAGRNRMMLLRHIQETIKTCIREKFIFDLNLNSEEAFVILDVEPVKGLVDQLIKEIVNE